MKLRVELLGFKDIVKTNNLIIEDEKVKLKCVRSRVVVVCKILF